MIIVDGVRVRLKLENRADAFAFVERLREQEDAFTIESRSGACKVDAKSLLGVIYTMLEFLDGIYLINETHAGVIPACVNSFLAVTA